MNEKLCSKFMRRSSRIAEEILAPINAHIEINAVNDKIAACVGIQGFGLDLIEFCPTTDDDLKNREKQKIFALNIIYKGIILYKEGMERKLNKASGQAEKIIEILKENN